MRKIPLFIGVVLFSAHFSAGLAAVPGQFIAKHYTEAMGRAPDQAGWQSYINFFQTSGCSKATLKSSGRTFYLSTEYSNLGYQNEEKILYRAT